MSMRTISTQDLKTGDILHCSRKGVISKLISWFTKSKITHTATVVTVWDQIYIVDAQKDGVNARPLQAWLEEYGYTVIVARNEVIPPDPREYSIEAFSKIGHTGYDFISLLWRHPWAIITGKWGKDKDPDDDRMVCSEYVAWLYDIVDPYRITPKKMHQYTTANNFTHYSLEY